MVVSSLGLLRRRIGASSVHSGLERFWTAGRVLLVVEVTSSVPCSGKHADVGRARSAFLGCSLAGQEEKKALLVRWSRVRLSFARMPGLGVTRRLLAFCVGNYGTHCVPRVAWFFLCVRAAPLLSCSTKYPNALPDMDPPLLPPLQPPASLDDGSIERLFF